MMKTTKKLFLGTLAAVSLMACEDTRSITTDPGGGYGYGTLFAKPAAANVPRGSIRFPVAGRLASATPASDSIVVEMLTADTLAAGAQYVVWAANDSGTKFVRLTGDLAVTRVDTTQNQAGDLVFSTTTTNRTGVSGWGVGGSNIRVRFRAFRAGQTGLVNTDSIGLIIVSTETAAVGTAPGNIRSVWARFTDATSSVAAIRFGTWARSVAAQYVYALSGASPGFVANPVLTPRGRMEIREGVVVAIDSNYFRPPVGYYYAMYGVKVDSLSNRPIDTLYMGARTGPAPERATYFNADADAALSLNNVIVAMNQRVKLDTISDRSSLGPAERPLKEFGFVNVTLQSKAAPEGRMGAGIIMQAALPPSMRGR
ncbi:MAG: hypothetical protein IBJ03_00540 [Gemmatimonadaceae bacterium]|nr:hypothetical protein [Gemmatimonadaceae bacterium]